MKRVSYLWLMLVLCACKKNVTPGSSPKNNGGNTTYAPSVYYNYDGYDGYVGQALYSTDVFDNYDIISFKGFAPDSTIEVAWGRKAFLTRAADSAGNITLWPNDMIKPNEGDTLILQQGSLVLKSVIFKQFEIRSWQDLQAMQQTLAGHYTLNADITFPDPGIWGFPITGFRPVGDDLMPFTGSFEGNGHSLSHLRINAPSSTLKPGGLFGTADIGSTNKISNFNIIQTSQDTIQTNVPLGSSYGTGTVAGHLLSGTLDSISVQGGLVLAVGFPGGGLVGMIGNPGVYTPSQITIKNSYTTCIVYADTAGGIIGENYAQELTVKNCYTSGQTGGQNFVGGLIGVLQGSNNLQGAAITIDQCHASGPVASGDGYGDPQGGIGGLVGTMSIAYPLIVTNCYTTMNINSNVQYTGGLIGRCGSLATLASCYTTGNITCAYDYVGGLIGAGSGKISNCYAKGDVSGRGYVGGLVGSAGLSYVDSASSTHIYSSFSSGDVKGAGIFVGGIVGNGADIIDCYVAGNISGGESYVGAASGELSTEIVHFFYSGKSITAFSGGYITGTGLPGPENVVTAPYIGIYFNQSATVTITNGTAPQGPLSGSELVSIASFTQNPGSVVKSTDPFKGFDFTNTWQFNSGGWPTLRNMPQ